MIRKFFDLSTAHVSPAARHWLEGVCHLNAIGSESSTYPNAGATLYGWALYAPVASEIEGHGLHADLVPVAEAARENECDWILFDLDGDLMDGLPIYGDEPDGDDGLTEEEKIALSHSIKNDDGNSGWFWLSFASDDAFLGAAIVEADTVMAAVIAAARMGICPGGDCMGIPIPNG